MIFQTVIYKWREISKREIKITTVAIEFNRTATIVGNAYFEIDNNENGILNAKKLLKYPLRTFD